jgi:hypothetical protein
VARVEFNNKKISKQLGLDTTLDHFSDSVTLDGTAHGDGNDDQEKWEVDFCGTDTSANRPRIRKPGGASEKRRTETTEAALPPVDSLEDAIEQERIEPMQVHSMLRCPWPSAALRRRGESVMHADVANVAARLIDRSVVRFQQVLDRFETGARDTESQSCSDS